MAGKGIFDNNGGVGPDTKFGGPALISVVDVLVSIVVCPPGMVLVMTKIVLDTRDSWLIEDTTGRGGEVS